MEIENTEATVEPTETQQPATGTREDLIAAVQAAATESGGATEAPAVAAAPTETTPAEPAPGEDRLSRIMRAREKAHAEQEAARVASQRMIDDANREAERIRQQANEDARQSRERSEQDLRDRFGKNPVETLRQLGDPQQVVDAALRAGTPEGRAQAALEKQIADAAALAREGKGAKDELAQFRKELAAERQAQVVEQVRQQFLSQHATKEAAPYLHAVSEAAGVDVFTKCDALCREWQKAGLVLNGSGETGFDQNDLVQYLEKQSREKLSKLVPATTPAAPSQAAGALATAPGNAPKVSANGPRTLSAAQGSERRSAPKPLHELSPAEQRKALIEEVEAARRANPDASF